MLAIPVVYKRNTNNSTIYSADIVAVELYSTCKLIITKYADKHNTDRSQTHITQLQPTIHHSLATSPCCNVTPSITL